MLKPKLDLKDLLKLTLNTFLCIFGLKSKENTINKKILILILFGLKSFHLSRAVQIHILIHKTI